MKAITQLVSEYVEHTGVSFVDVQKILQDLIHSLNIKKVGVLYFDVSYIYTWHLSDLPIIQKVSREISKYGYYWNYEFGQWVERNWLAVKWHENLERWVNGEYVRLYDKEIKPIAIERTFDRVPNEFLFKITNTLVGKDKTVSFKYHGMGDGGLKTRPTPADVALINEIDRINAKAGGAAGGSISHDGSTFIMVANHKKSVQDFNASETGVFSTSSPTTDVMLDHSTYQNAIVHLQNQDAPGGTSIVFQCST